jgi:hypothetical protein
MSLFQKLFGQKQAEAKPTESSQKPKPREVLLQKDGDSPIPIDPQSITHAFIALTHKDINHSDEAAKVIAQLNRRLQPRIWNIPFTVKFVAFTANAAENGYPEATAIPVALEKVGLASSSSVVIHDMEVSFDGMTTQSKMYVGFAFRDENPRIILPNKDGCVPR